MAQRYFFVLGRTPALSVGELTRVVNGGEWAILPSVAILDSPSPLSSQELMRRLGGCIKIGTIIGSVPRESLGDWITRLRWKKSAGRGKFNFGFSDYAVPRVSELKKIGIALKRALQAEGVASRLVTSRERQLSSVIVAKNGLLTDGVELCLFNDGPTIIIGQTAAVQDFEAFSARDFGRPSDQAKAGMLPPKVARMMIHLAQPRPTDSLLDPFCGAGTVLQEALDVGLTQVVGADIDREAVGIATKNLQWYLREFAPDKKMPEIIQSDILQLQKRLLGRRFDHIVAEGYLGPPLNPRVPVARRRAILAELQGFYQRAIPILSQLLAPRGTMVLALPVLLIENQWQRLSLSQVYSYQQLTIEPVVPEALAEALQQTEPTVIYSRPQQQVGREIVILKKKNGT